MHTHRATIIQPWLRLSCQCPVLSFHLPLKTKYSEIASGTSGYSSWKITWGKKKKAFAREVKKKKGGFTFFKRKNIHSLVLKYTWGIKEEQEANYTEDRNTMEMGGNQLMGCFHTIKQLMHNFQRHLQISLPSNSIPYVSGGSSEQTCAVFCFLFAPL